MTHICVSELTIIGSDNGLSPGRRQAITWTNDEILLIGSLGTNFSQILIKIYTFSFKKMHWKMPSGKWRPSCLSLNVLIVVWFKASVNSQQERVITCAYFGGRFKNTYELLNLRALKFSPVNKSHIFQCLGKIFCVEFQRYPLKFHTKYLTHTLKDMIFIQYWNSKSS